MIIFGGWRFFLDFFLGGSLLILTIFMDILF